MSKILCILSHSSTIFSSIYFMKICSILNESAIKKSCKFKFKSLIHKLTNSLNIKFKINKFKVSIFSSTSNETDVKT